MTKIEKYLKNNKILSIWKNLYAYDSPIIRLHFKYLEEFNYLQYAYYLPIKLQSRKNVKQILLFFNSNWISDCKTLLWFSVDLSSVSRFGFYIKVDNNGEYILEICSLNSYSTDYLKVKKIPMDKNILNTELPKDLEAMVISGLNESIKIISRYIMFGSWTLCNLFIENYCE